MICSDLSTDCLTTISSIAIAGITASALTISIHLTKNQLKRTAKIEEQKFFLEIDRIFMREDNLKVSSSIYREIYQSEIFHIDDAETEKILSNYLSDLEFVCNLYTEEIVTKDQLDALVGMAITNAIKCVSVKNYIKQERVKTQIDTLWTGVETVAKELESQPKK